MLTFNEEVIM